ncbi:tyrosine-type recombinase/integrase [Microbacterium lacticum]|uniref:tyrosine-type recombinase/integrase n=3 Tax=Microbacterium lacticum TaxID=33885 RepID=UPI001476F95E
MLRELRIPAVRWHDLRHFYASACASVGIPIERVAKYMGHADIGTMYKHYLHLFSDDHTDDMARLAAVASRPALQPMAQLGVLTSTVVDSVDGGFASDAEVVPV